MTQESSGQLQDQAAQVRSASRLSRRRVSVSPQFVQCSKCEAVADEIIVEVRKGQISIKSVCCNATLSGGGY